MWRAVQLTLQAVCMLRALGAPRTAPQDETPTVCTQLDISMPVHLLYTGQTLVGHLPVLEFKLSELTSFDSEFELRTLDPEGIIFFGDIVSSWFLLAVHQGRLIVQTARKDGESIVVTGPLISDGEWKKVLVSKQEGGVSVRVGGAEPVWVEQSTELVEGVLRIAIGSLTPGTNVSLQLNPAFDGCMRSWDWVKQDTSVLQQRLQESAVLRCWEHIVPGAYFAGEGAAGFATWVVLENVTQEQTDPRWNLTVELAFRTASHGGVLFAIVDPDNQTVLSLSINELSQEMVVQFRGQLFTWPSVPSDLCSGGSQFLHLQVTESRLVMVLGSGNNTEQLHQKDFEHLQAVWNQPGTRLYLGGLPGGSSFFHGCLQTRIQGVTVDLDTAETKHGGVRSHSCPSALDIRDGK